MNRQRRNQKPAYTPAQRVGAALVGAGGVMACLRAQQLGLGTDVQMVLCLTFSVWLGWVAIEGDL